VVRYEFGGMTEPGSSIVELRRYALRPGARETLIELFEREFVETQEAFGIRVLGTFRDADDPDSFVWIRGFTDMPARARALQAFYGGPDWAEHGSAANATMIDVDNVLLLRPVDQASRLALDTSRRPPAHAPTPASGVASVTICPLEPGHAPAFSEVFDREIEPALRQAGGGVRARFVTEHSENTFPALPVREREEVFVWLSLFADEQARSAHTAAIDLAALLGEHLAGEPKTLRLEPTSRSLLPDETAGGAPGGAACR
jgi:quinol monooxygenase YgiN